MHPFSILISFPRNFLFLSFFRFSFSVSFSRLGKGASALEELLVDFFSKYLYHHPEIIKCNRTNFERVMTSRTQYPAFGGIRGKSV